MTRFLPVGLLSLAVIGCDAMSAHTGVVARAGQYELGVDAAADMLVAYPRIPATTEVVGSVADLWLDYTILADVLSRDTTLARLDLDPLLEPYVEQRIFVQLRDRIATTDTLIDDDELRRLFDERAPGRRARARHILISFPEDATRAQQDSVRELAEDIRERAVAGADFGELARRFSDDPGSGPRGGDLGWFEAGQMVRPFEEAAFRLQPGEISPVTETLFGLHVIKMEERETPAFEERAGDFRQRVVQERRQESLSEYVESLTEPLNMRIESGAHDVARDLAQRPAARLAPRAATRSLVSWRGGSLTAGGYANFLRRLAPQQRAQFAAAQDEQLEAVLKDVATHELVLADARQRGITVPQAERDSVRALIREQIVEVAREARLTGPAQEDETRQQAVQRRVRSLLDSILSGEEDLLPLGGLPYVLRQQMDWQIHERSFNTVVARVEDRREGPPREPAPAPPLEDPAPITTPPGPDG